MTVHAPLREMAAQAGPVIGNRLLAGLPDADRDALRPHLRETPLNSGEVLFEPGDEVAHVWFPHSGAVSLVMILADGPRVEAFMAGREGATDPLALAGPRPAVARAVVQLPGDAARVETGRLREIAQARPAVRAMLDRYAASLFGEIQQAVACNAAHRMAPRLAKWLLRSHDRADADVLPLTQEFLAEMLGAQRTTVTETARALQVAGAVDYRRGRITIRDRGILERLSCECYAATAPRA